MTDTLSDEDFVLRSIAITVAAQRQPNGKAVETMLRRFAEDVEIAVREKLRAQADAAIAELDAEPEPQTQEELDAELERIGYTRTDIDLMVRRIKQTVEFAKAVRANERAFVLKPIERWLADDRAELPWLGGIVAQLKSGEYDKALARETEKKRKDALFMQRLHDWANTPEEGDDEGDEP